MTDYTKTTNFTAKDALSAGDPNKIIRGSLFDTEFDAISVAVATKYDSGDLASQAEAEAGALNTKLMTPLRTQQWFADELTAVHTWTAIQTMSSTQPVVRFIESDANVDETTWDIRVNGGLFQIFTRTDALVAGTLAYSADRTAGAIAEITYGNVTDLPTHTFQGSLEVAGDPVVLESRALTGGTMIAALGDLSSDRTISVDVDDATALGANAFDSAADFVAIYDTSATATKKVLGNNLISNTSQIGYRGVPGTAHNADYTLALADMSTMLKHTSASDHAWTIPPHGSIAFPADEAAIAGHNLGTGVVTLTEGAGVTLLLAGTTYDGDIEVAQYGMFVIYQSTEDTWIAQGSGLSPA